jgi:hypothetical protein
MANKIDVIVPQRVESIVRTDLAGLLAEVWNERAECGNPGCTRRWLTFLKDRRRPVFEQRWGCSTSCLNAIVSAAIRRESAEAGAAGEDTQHNHRLPLGLILLGQGWITHAQLQRALDAQRRAGSGRIGRWLIEECGVRPDQITRALGMQWGCPVLRTDGFDPDAMALAAPRLLVEAMGVVPLRTAGRRFLYLAFVDRPDASTAFALERMSGLKAESGLADPAQWSAAQRMLCASGFVEQKFEQVVDIESMSRKIASTLAGMQPRASHLVRVHQFYWLRMWLEEGAMSTPDGGIPPMKEDVVDRIYKVGREQ